MLWPNVAECGGVPNILAPAVSYKTLFLLIRQKMCQLDIKPRQKKPSKNGFCSFNNTIVQQVIRMYYFYCWGVGGGEITLFTF